MKNKNLERNQYIIRKQNFIYTKVTSNYEEMSKLVRKMMRENAKLE